MRRLVAPFSYTPIMSLLPGLWRTERGVVIFPSRILPQPALLKFVWHWLTQPPLMQTAYKSNTLTILNEKLLVYTIDDTGMSRKDVEYFEGVTHCCFDNLPMRGFKTAAEAYEKYSQKNAALIKLRKDRPLVTPEQLWEGTI